MSAVELLVVVLATYRLTRLVTTDYLLDTPRRWVQARVPEKVAYLIGCSWCLSVWVGAAVGTAVTLWPSNGLDAALLALALSAGVGLIATHLDPPEDYGEPDGGQVAE